MKGNNSCRHGENPTEFREKLAKLYCDKCDRMQCICPTKAEYIAEIKEHMQRLMDEEALNTYGEG